MPSLHFGYSFTIGMSLFFFSPHRWLARIGPLYPALILLVIVSTANHYVLDAVAGFVVSVAAWKINHILLNLRPLEEWGFWLCRTEKPMDVSLVYLLWSCSGELLTLACRRSTSLVSSLQTPTCHTQ
jgi:hypothetical protein